MKICDTEDMGDAHDSLHRDDPLWDLLGKARPVDVSPFFARNVLREVRLTQECAPSPLFGRLFRRWRLVAISVGALAVVAVNGFVLLHDRDNNAIAQHPGDVEAISNLDELLAYEPSDIWLDKSVY